MNEHPVKKPEDLMGGKLAQIFAYHTQIDPEQQEEFLQKASDNKGKYDSLLDDFESYYGYRPPQEIIEFEESLPAYQKDAGLSEEELMEQLMDEEFLDELAFLPVTFTSFSVDKYDLNDLENDREFEDFARKILTGIHFFAEPEEYPPVYFCNTLPNPMNTAEVYSYEGYGIEPSTYSIAEYIATHVFEMGYESDDDIMPIIEEFRITYNSKRVEIPYYYDPLVLQTRAEWLLGHIYGEIPRDFSRKIKNAPDFSVWEQEKQLIPHISVIANYWLLAHFFLGNINACKECIKLSEETPGQVTSEIAKIISDALNNLDNADAEFFQMSTEKIKELIEKTQKNAPLELFEPELRKEFE
ncbi:MAG: hypothetical protein ACOC2J_00230 [bacterium]